MPDASLLFSDLEIPEMPSAISSKNYEKLYVGEGVISKLLKNGKYEVKTHEGDIINCRGVFNIGETVLPSGIAVFVVTHNAEGWILGKIRATLDDDKDDGSVDTDKSAIVGSEGDATLRPHLTSDDSISSEVTVTRGGVVRLKSTGATSITMHPHGERLIQKCQTLLAFSDAYRIESGRVTSKAGVSLTALTEEAYKDKVGPARTEVRIKNGSVDVTALTVHQFSVDTLTTAAGATTGLANFRWKVDSTGKWDVVNGLKINFGDIANEPVVLGSTLVKFLKALMSEMTSIRGALSTLGVDLAATTVANLSLKMPLTGAALTASAVKSSGAVTALQGVYLDSTAVLSDFFATQKLPPVPGVIKE
jgi:hypothetical protein